MVDNITFLNNFCGFWSVAINTMEKLQFLVNVQSLSIIDIGRPALADAHNRPITSFSKQNNKKCF